METHEQEASEMGWVPKEKWTGPEDKWIDAETFLKRGETILPILIKNKRDLAEKVKAQEEEIRQLRADGLTFKEALEKQATREKAALEAQIRELTAQRAQQITDGEGAEVVQTEAQIEALKRQKEALDVKKPPAQEPPVHPDYPGWIAENRWYVEDESLQILANGIAGALLKKDPTLKGRKLFDLVKKEVVKLDTFKEKYPDNSPAAHNRVEGGEDTTPSEEARAPSGRAKTYENLPIEAKQTCDRYIKNGWITDRQGKTLAEKRAAYAKMYYEEQR